MSTGLEFDSDYFTRLAAAREHWWVQGMQLSAAALLEGGGPDARVLDAGCGTGSNLAWAAGLTTARPVCAVDLVPGAVALAARALPAGQVAAGVASAAQLPYADGSFDLVVSLDVLQHLPVEVAAAALREFRRVLAPGGRALLRTNAAFGRGRVPQRADWRLYTPASLRADLETAGLRVTRLTSVNALQSLWASAPRRRPVHAHEHAQTAAHTGHHGLGIPRPTGRVRNAVLRRVLAAEAAFLRAPGRALPFGHSLLAVAERVDGAQA